MSKTIVNLSISVVSEEADLVLKRYPQQPYQTLFSEPNLRQKLIVHVLSRIPGLYTVLDDEVQSCAADNYPLLTEEEQQKIHALLHEGIQQLANQYADEMAMPSRQMQPESLPSHWFG